jgi:ABC-type phosphate/phosphonate transport system substrate-binding protein
MIAALGMYDRPETAAAHDRYWALIRDALRAGGLAAPEGLTRGDGAFWPAWRSHDLVLSQTCGLPYRHRLHGQVTLIGTPDYGLPDCPAGHYNSVFVVRATDPRTDLAEFQHARFAYNDGMSQSGWAAPQNHAAGLGFRFTCLVETGGHALSARAVAEGRADIAAMDALTYELCLRHDPVMARLRAIVRTEPTPSLPYIAAMGAQPKATFDAVATAIAALALQDREALHLRGIVKIPAERYLAVTTPDLPADLAAK